MKLTKIAVFLGVISAVCSLHAQTWDTLHKSAYSVWVTPDYSLAACNTYKNNIESVATELDKAIPLIVQYLEIAPPDETIIAESFSHVTISLFHIKTIPVCSEPLLPNFQ
jgi:hypothetical protein